jgi:hypothetical protein
MTTIGYARVSTTDQDLDIQIAALKREGCTTIRFEKRSGTTTTKMQKLGAAQLSVSVLQSPFPMSPHRRAVRFLTLIQSRDGPDDGPVRRVQSLRYDPLHTPSRKRAGTPSCRPRRYAR